MNESAKTDWGKFAVWYAKKNRGRLIKFGMIVGVIALVIMIGNWWNGVMNPDPNSPLPESSQIAKVTQACRDEVREHLRSPSSAEFSDEGYIPLEGGQWKISGQVDAENAFGASLRHTFTCEGSATRLGTAAKITTLIEN